ncbi:MAG: SatD family protein [Flavobacteriales bacterium]
MLAILTGDIINSREVDIKTWLPKLKAILKTYGKSPKDWEIFRGDSFQLKVKIEEAFWTSIHIKSVVKQLDRLDARIGIGIGEESYTSKNITESNGSAYIHSGESFESLKKDTLAIKSEHSERDYILNLMLQLIFPTIDNWTPTVSKIIKTYIENPKLNQKELAKLLGKSQSSVSEALNRGGYYELLKLNTFYVSQFKNG